MRKRSLTMIGATGAALVATALFPASASASSVVDYDTLTPDVQAGIINTMNLSAMDIGGQTYKVNGNGGPCFGVYAGRVTFDSSGRITKIETATVEFYQPVLSCLI